MTPVSVYSSRNGSVAPKAAHSWLMMPCRQRMTIHANVRTTTLVRIGMIVRKIRIA